MPDTVGDPSPNVRSTRYIIVESKTRCPHCDVVSAVFAIALPAGYESLYLDDDRSVDDNGDWEVPGMAAVLSYVEYLPEAVAERIRALTPHYRFDRSHENGESFWINHCEHCGTAMAEEELHGEPEGPFGRMSYEGLEAIRLHEVREPFEGWAGGESHDLTPLDS